MCTLDFFCLFLLVLRYTFFPYLKWREISSIHCRDLQVGMPEAVVLRLEDFLPGALQLGSKSLQAGHFTKCMDGFLYQALRLSFFSA